SGRPQSDRAGGSRAPTRAGETAAERGRRSLAETVPGSVNPGSTHGGVRTRRVEGGSGPRGARAARQSETRRRRSPLAVRLRPWLDGRADGGSIHGTARTPCRVG